MNSSRCSWESLFENGKWKQCCDAIKLDLKGLSLASSDQNYIQSKRICLENNFFVCDQLSHDWDSGTEDDVASAWAKGYDAISLTYNAMRGQSVLSELPLDLVLCVTHNFLWWTAMKVDPLHRYSCRKQTLAAACFSFKAVARAQGAWNSEHQFTGWIESDYIQAAKTCINCLLKLTQVQCQLAVEIMALVDVIILDDNTCQDENQSIDFMHIMSQLVDYLPQINVHFSAGDPSINSNYGCILKFGWFDIVDVLKLGTFAMISETLLIAQSNLCIKLNEKTSKENSTMASKCLNMIDKDNLTFPFLYHYMQSLVNFHMGNLDRSLYHLEQSFMCNCNLFMQSRSKTLKGQILLLQEKPAAALEVLQSVEFKSKEIQIPLCAFLIGKAYGMLGKVKQQTEVLELLEECLSAEPAVQPKLLSPMAGMGHRLLLSAHVQPEISLEEVLKSSAMALLTVQNPKQASEKLLEFLHMITINLNDGTKDEKTMWELSEFLHDATSALLEANSVYEAQEVCDAALQFHSSRVAFRSSTVNGLSSLKEDVIALLLLAEIKEKEGSPDVSDILNRCSRLLQNLLQVLSKLGEEQKESVSLCKALLARVFLQKATLHVRRKFEDDAVACFQRALHWKADDAEVILQFAGYLLGANQIEESLALWQMLQECEKVPEKSSNYTLDRLLGKRMSSKKREEILSRLEGLNSS